MLPDISKSPLVPIARSLSETQRAPRAGFASITRGSLRVASAEGLIVEGSARVSGSLIVSGNESITGTLEVSGIQQVTGTLIVDGDLDVNGPTNITGPTVITGTFQIDGETTINGHTVVNGIMDFNGALNLTGTMTVNGAGKVVVGNLTIDPGGAYGGRITAGGGGILYLDAVNVLAREYISADGLSIGALGATILGDFTVFGAKSFGIEHPAKPGVLLRHSATESPVSGTEYVGSDVFDEDGQCVITLPDYFESLNKPDNRFVFITPVGRPFATGAESVTDGSFTAYGEPGRSFSWLVKAERIGGDFEVESPMPERPIQESNSGQ